MENVTLISLTESNKILEVLKSLYMIGFSASSCRNARPFAAPSIIFILLAHERGTDRSANIQHYCFSFIKGLEYSSNKLS